MTSGHPLSGEWIYVQYICIWNSIREILGLKHITKGKSSTVWLVSEFPWNKQASNFIERRLGRLRDPAVKFVDSQWILRCALTPTLELRNARRAAVLSSPHRNIDALHCSPSRTWSPPLLFLFPFLPYLPFLVQSLPSSFSSSSYIMNFYTLHLSI